MSHTDYISQIAPGFEISAHTADCPVATAENADKNLYAIQFHPEVLHTAEGTKMLSNFVLGVCGCAGDWKMDAFVENTIKEIREKVGDGKVLLALSGGVDSSVAAGLLSRAIGKQLTCVFVDHGLLRKDEGDEVEGVFGPNGQFDLNFIRVNAQRDIMINWQELQSLKQNVRLSVKNLSVSLRKKQRRSVQLISWHRNDISGRCREWTWRRIRSYQISS